MGKYADLVWKRHGALDNNAIILAKKYSKFECVFDSWIFGGDSEMTS